MQISWVACLFAVQAFANVPEKPKNIILFIGDGMGLAHVALMEYLQKKDSGLSRMEAVGLQKTHSASHLITDSGASATAMSSGVKTFNSGIGVGPDSTPVKTIIELAEENGLQTGFIVTSSVVHATPAAFYAHVASRGAYEEIAKQLCTSGIDVFVGGGEKYFRNRFSDNKDLLYYLGKNDYHIVHTGDEVGMYRISAVPEEKRIACFTAYEDPPRAQSDRTYLPDVSRQVIQALEKRADNGYFLMIEASQVDWASHANDPAWLIAELKDAWDTIEDLIKAAMEDEDTLLIITSDHESGYLSLTGKRKPVLEFQSRVHTCQMVPVFASGPGAEVFAGMYDNTDIFWKMKDLLGL